MTQVPQSPEIDQQVRRSGYVLTPPAYQKKHTVDHTQEISVLTQERDNALHRVEQLEHKLAEVETALAEAISQIPVVRPRGRPKKVVDHDEEDSDA